MYHHGGGAIRWVVAVLPHNKYVVYKNLLREIRRMKSSV